jgi:hypothetical protein
MLASQIEGRKRRSAPQTFRFLFSAAAAALALTCALAPQAKADDVLVYFNFEDGTFNSVPAPGPGSYTFLQSTTITNVNFPTGQLSVVDSNLGTNLNSLADESTGHALKLGGVTQRTRTYCFEFSVNTTGYTNLSLSFALNSIFGVTGPNPQFNTVTAYYSVNGGTTFTQFATQSITQNAGYVIYTFPMPSGADNKSNVIIELCFSGAGNQANGNATYIDNIQLTGVVPEPATTAGGILGVLGLCWFQRQRLRSLLPRRGFLRPRRF